MPEGGRRRHPLPIERQRVEGGSETHDLVVVRGDADRQIPLEEAPRERLGAREHLDPGVADLASVERLGSRNTSERRHLAIAVASPALLNR